MPEARMMTFVRPQVVLMFVGCTYVEDRCFHCNVFPGMLVRGILACTYGGGRGATWYTYSDARGTLVQIEEINAQTPDSCVPIDGTNRRQQRSNLRIYSCRPSAPTVEERTKPHIGLPCVGVIIKRETTEPRHWVVRIGYI